MKFSILIPKDSEIPDRMFVFLIIFLGFDKAKLESMEAYLKAVKLFRNEQDNLGEPEYSQVSTK